MWRIVADAQVALVAWVVGVLLLPIIIDVVGVPVIPHLDGMGASATDESKPSGHLPSDHDDVADNK